MPVRSAFDRRRPEQSPIVSIVRIVPARLWRSPQAVSGMRLRIIEAHAIKPPARFSGV